ncbi:hypothetical protein PV646_22655 [Streptomyces sp. ID05-26A]|nr:hypothetical protein [Streptomyces sp. ID05-26A]
MTTTPSARSGEPSRPPLARKPVPTGERSVTEHLDNGAVVTYFDPSPFAEGPFRRAVAIGAEIVDPRTNLRWIPLLRGDLTIDLVAWALVVDIAPG